MAAEFFEYRDGDNPNISLLKSFICEYNKDAVPNVCIVMSCVNKNTLEILGIGARPSNEGYGSKAMIRLVMIADEMSIVLDLKPKYTERERLIRFYKRFGFKTKGEDRYITRKPKGCVLKKILCTCVSWFN